MKVVHFVVGLGAILLSQAALVAALTGVGLLLRRGFGLTRLTLDDLFEGFWMGFAGAVLLLMLWNFVLPVNLALLLLVLAAGGAGLLSWRRALGELRAARPPLGRAWAATFIVAALWVANLGLGDMTYFDTALYHMQTVEWAERYPVVPGLANLSAPLAYNNAGLLFAAMLDTGPWAGLGFRLANGLLMQVLLLRVLVALVRLTRHGERPSVHEMFVALFLPAAISLSYFGRLSSYATAPPTAILCLVVAERLHAMLVREREDPAQGAYDLVVIVALSAACVALKLSAIVYCALIVVVAVAAWLRGGRSRADVRRGLAFSLGAALLIGGAWTARGVILSGYPAFPSRVVAAPVDWRVPAEHADAEYALVEHSSKVSTMLDDVIAGRDRWGWLPRWTRVQLAEPFYVFVPLGISLLAALTAFADRLRAGPGEPRSAAPLLMLVPILPALLAWFWLAPEARYVTGVIWALVALAGSRAWSGLAARSGTRPRQILVSAAVVAAATMIATPWASARNEARRSLLKTVIKQNVKLWEAPAWRTVRRPPLMDTYVTRSGLVLSVPPRGRCWDAPPPCTQNPAPNLELRSPPDLRSGFRVRGEWAMENWPSKSRPRFLSAWRESRKPSVTN